jgi:hypothetical protein
MTSRDPMHPRDPMHRRKVRGTERPLSGRCGARLRNGRHCASFPVGGSGRCRMHGGASLAGPAHPNWKDGRRSQSVRGAFAAALAGDLGRHYRAALKRHVSLRDEVALLEAREVQLLECMETGSPASWHRVGALTVEMRAAVAGITTGGSTAVLAGLASGLDELSMLAQRGADTERTWRALLKTIDVKRRLVIGETRRMRVAHEVIDRGRFLAIMAFIGDAVVRHVTNPAELKALREDFEILFGGAQ